MKIALLGYGDQGRAAYEYWDDPKNTITICDQNPVDTVPNGAKTRFGSDYLQDLDDFDLLIRTPSLHPQDIVEANPNHPNILHKVNTVTNEFFWACPSQNIIGVTGTKGKGTTSTLIARILEAAGKTVHLGGNIGIPPLDLLKHGIKPDDWVVLELANFQLIDLHYSPHVAVCLMIVPEHLNWHKSFYEYVRSKEQLFVHQNTDDVAVYNALNLYAQEIATASPAHQKLTYEVPPPDQDPSNTEGAYLQGDHIHMGGKRVCSTHDVHLLGRHNLENVCAAIAATWDIVEHDHKLIKNVIKAFAGLPYRLEFIGEVNKIRYYNDSFASAPDAATAAMTAIPGTKVMIVGGFDRGLDLTEFANSAVDNSHLIRKLLLIGESAPRLAETLRQQKFINYQVSTSTNMPTILGEANKLALEGDAVVLSPGFASFDMFKNFEDRGLQFKAAVNDL